MGSWDRSRELHDQNEFADREYDPAATPTTEAIRATYATDYYMTDVRGSVTAEERAAAFDRWLAAHDAELVSVERERAALHAEEGYRMEERCDDIAKRIRSGAPAEIAPRPGVVAEEPEWEYGWRSRFATGGPVFQELEWGSREQAEQSIRDHEQWEADDPKESRLVYEVVKRTPAVRAGEWVPAKQEGTEQ